VLRAHQIAVTEPTGPTFVCLDAGLQEGTIEVSGPLLPPLERFAPPRPTEPPADALAEAARPLSAAKRPLRAPGLFSALRGSFRLPSR